MRLGKASKGIALDNTDLNSNAEALFRRASTCLRAGRFAEAQRHYQALLRLQPNHLGALNLFGILLIRTGRYDEAERALRAALDDFFSSRHPAPTFLVAYDLVGKPVSTARTRVFPESGTFEWTQIGNIRFAVVKPDGRLFPDRALEPDRF
jgi:Flp pilus assembly protein TadD